MKFLGGWFLALMEANSIDLRFEVEMTLIGFKRPNLNRLERFPNETIDARARNEPLNRLWGLWTLPHLVPRTLHENQSRSRAS
jgi:hypothetical protein